MSTPMDIKSQEILASTQLVSDTMQINKIPISIS